MKEEKQESRLSRWSRRKQQTAQETKKEDLALEIQQLQETDLPGTPAAEDQQKAEEPEPVLTDADMPAIETLTEDSNYSQFMSAGVSDELRNLALRKMFSAPFFNIRDGLDEYDGDYTSFEKLGDIVTADMRHQMEIEAQKKLAAEAAKITESESNAEIETELLSIDDTRELAVDGEDEIEEEVDTGVASQTPETDTVLPPAIGRPDQ